MVSPVQGQFQQRVRPAMAELLTAFVSILIAELVVSGLVVAGLLPPSLPTEPDRWAWLLYGPLRSGLAVGIYFILASADARETPTFDRAPLPASAGWVAVYVTAATGGSVLLGELGTFLGSPAREQAQLLSVVERTAEGGSLAPALALVFGAVVLAPAFEELLFRGLMFRRLIPVLGLAWAVLASSVAFSFIHGNLSGAPIYFWLGLCFAGLYYRTGRVGAAVTAHVANNAFALILLFWGS